MSVEKDFEELLNDFINNQIEKEVSTIVEEDVSESELELELEPYVCRGVTYYLPSVNKPDYTFDSVIIKDDIDDCDCNRFRSSFVLKTEAGNEPTIYAELANISLKDKDWEHKAADMLVLLYRVGNSYPIFIWRKSERNFNYITTINLSKVEGGWRPGEYFLLIANADCEDELEKETCWDTLHSHVRFSFRMLPDGSTMEHPNIKKFSLSADGFVKVRLQGATTLVDVYSLQLYNSKWVKMASVDGLSAYRGKLKSQLFSPYYWTDGAYSLVVLHNEEPCLLVTLDWKNESLNGYTWSKIDFSSPYYMLSKYLQEENSWLKLCGIPGCGSLRKAMLKRYGYQVLNKWRTLQGRSRISQYTHMSIAVTDGRYQEQLALSCARLLNTQVDLTDGNCERLVESKNGYDSYEDMQGLFSDCEYKTICLHHLSAMISSPNGRMLMHLVEESLQTERRWSLILMGTPAEISQVLESSSIIERYITAENRFYTESFSVQEQIYLLQTHLVDMGLHLSANALKKLNRLLTTCREYVASWREEELFLWWKKDIFPRYINRVLRSGKKTDSCEMYNVEEEDLFMEFPATPKDEFEESVRELNEMVGLENLKRNMVSLFNRNRFEKARKDMGLPIPLKGGYHMIFTGNPGTGKTTVAKLVGKIYHSLGILSKGSVVFTERSKLVGRYLGETEKNMVAVLEQAKGNVLFIDEAYSLCDNDGDNRKDFGCRVLESLLTVLSQKDPDMIVIMAGYEKEMNQMLEMNPGMKGRFPYKFNFEDYQADELYQIACNLLERSEYVLTSEADTLLREKIQEAVQHKDAFFHNARWIEQFILDGVISALSDRLMNLPLCLNDRSLLQTIEKQDIEEGYQKMKPQPVWVTAPRKRIGFVA